MIFPRKQNRGWGGVGQGTALVQLEASWTGYICIPVLKFVIKSIEGHMYLNYGG